MQALLFSSKKNSLYLFVYNVSARLIYSSPNSRTCTLEVIMWIESVVYANKLPRKRATLSMYTVKNRVDSVQRIRYGMTVRVCMYV